MDDRNSQPPVMIHGMIRRQWWLGMFILMLEEQLMANKLGIAYLDEQLGLPLEYIQGKERRQGGCNLCT